jgi:hypothetical protein
MACPHPAEERKAVYSGGMTPVPGRSYCALCGEVLIVVEQVAGDPPPAFRILPKSA